LTRELSSTWKVGLRHHKLEHLLPPAETSQAWVDLPQPLLVLGPRACANMERFDETFLRLRDSHAIRQLSRVLQLQHSIRQRDLEFTEATLSHQTDRPLYPQLVSTRDLILRLQQQKIPRLNLWKQPMIPLHSRIDYRSQQNLRIHLRRQTSLKRYLKRERSQLP
jgi:hypothetical protein